MTKVNVYKETRIEYLKRLINSLEYSGDYGGADYYRWELEQEMKKSKSK